MNKVQVCNRIYLKGWYNNVPIKDTWNASVISAMKDLEEDIERSDLDVTDIELEQWDKNAEANLQGVIGYSARLDEGLESDAFYVDFKVPNIREDYTIQAIDTALTQALLSSLSEYVASTEGYELSKCIHDAGTELDELVLRAYFVRL